MSEQIALLACLVGIAAVVAIYGRTARQPTAPTPVPDIVTEFLGRWVLVTLRSGSHAGGRLVEAKPGRIVLETIDSRRVVFAASPGDVLSVVELDAHDCEQAAAAHQVAMADREGRH